MEDLKNKIEESSCSFLKKPININELIENGSTFEIDADFSNNIADDLNEIHLDSPDENINEEAVDSSTIVSPWTNSFNELKSQMKQISPYIWKRVVKEGDENSPHVSLNCRVHVHYNAYYEGESTPFDSTYLRNSTCIFYTGRGEVIEGLESAVATMLVGEEAHFLISYRILFGALGCPPRIKRKEDALFAIKLIKFNQVGDLNAEKNISESDRCIYAKIRNAVTEIITKAKDFYLQGLNYNAIRAYDKAVALLKYSETSNEDEKRERDTVLLKIYTNLAVCFNKLDKPHKCFAICQEIRALTCNKPTSKALFHEGRAYIKLGEYAKAHSVLLKAHQLNPNNLDISEELKILDERFEQHKNSEREMWSKIFKTNPTKK